MNYKPQWPVTRYAQSIRIKIKDHTMPNHEDHLIFIFNVCNAGTKPLSPTIAPTGRGQKLQRTPHVVPPSATLDMGCKASVDRL